MYEKMLLEINQSKAQIAICGSIVDNGFRLKGTPLYGKKEIWNNAELMKMYVASPYISAVPWNKLYSYELLKEIRFPNFRANEDAFIMHQILGRCKKAAYLNENLYIQYIRPGSTEQSRYSEKNLALLECAKNLQLYYKEKLPDLYEYVAYKYINDSASLLGKIVKSCNFYFYRKQYNEIYDDMCKEYKKISSEVSEDMRISSDAKCAIFHPGLFIVRSFGQGIVIKIKTIIKRCLGKIIRPLCYMIDSAN